MVTLIERLNAGPQGDAVTLANAPGASHIVLNGGTMTYDVAGAGAGPFGAKLVSSSTPNPIHARLTLPTPALQLSHSVVITTPSANPSANVSIISCYTAAVAPLFHLIWTNDGKLIQRRTASNTTTENLVAGAGVIPLGKKLRITTVLNIAVAGSFTVKVYDYATGALMAGVPALTVSSYDFGTTPGSYFDAGLNSGVAGPLTTYVADMQLQDGTQTELPNLSAPAASTVYPTTVTANAGGWTNVGGATSIPAALADASDATYAESPGVANNETITLKLGTLSAGDRRIRVRTRATAAGNVRIELLEGTTVRATWVQAVTTTMADYPFVLTTAQNAAITDNANLFVRISGRAV